MTKGQEKKTRENYALWLLNECSNPIEEIHYLFANLPIDHKENIYSDFKKDEQAYE